MAYDAATALEAVKKKYPDTRFVTMTELPTKFIFEYAASTDELVFGIAMDTFYSVDKTSGEIENYTPYEEDDPNTFFDAASISIKE